LRAELSHVGTFSIFTQSGLRQRVLEIFDQTFAITGILRAIAVAVAVLGVVLALLVLAMERKREISLLRALGASTRQVTGHFLVQAAWVGLVSAMLGGICGLCLAVLLVQVVNPAFFGWTIPLHPVWSELAALPVWLTAVAVLAGWYPAWRATREDIAPALRLE
jgi:putative ABC transport system permease protein